MELTALNVGATAIVALQKLAGIEVTFEAAKESWKQMTPQQRGSTMACYQAYIVEKKQPPHQHLSCKLCSKEYGELDLNISVDKATCPHCGVTGQCHPVAGEVAP